MKRHEAEEPGGMRVVRELIHHPGSAVILPLFRDRRILMIRQYRLAVGAVIWELPAGTIDRGETPIQTARRELAEETGYRSTRWRKLYSFFPSPGLMAERMHLFLAQDIRPGTADPEGDERISAHSFSLAELLRLIRAGKIIDAKSLVALLYWARWGSVFTVKAN
ncbi:MAG: NUDIX hydrolase [Acidobacteria bacterium]|nr:NUDIX hydrolase [Acidobacteriota bacterium]